MTEKKTMSMKFDDTGITPEVLIDAVNFMYRLDLSVVLTNCAGLLDIAERFVMDDLKREANKHFAEGLKLNKNILGTEPHGRQVQCQGAAGELCQVHHAGRRKG